MKLLAMAPAPESDAPCICLCCKLVGDGEVGLSGNGFIKMNRVMGPPSGVKFPDRAALKLAGSAVKTTYY